MRRGNSSAGSGAPRLVGIEGLRAIAASSILVYHVWLYGAPQRGPVDLGMATKAFDNLRAGVTLFFALSGFLLFRPYVASALRNLQTPSARQYLRNRALRILPLYWVVLLVVVLVYEQWLLRDPGRLAANVFFAQNYVPSAIFTGITPAWSVAIEVVFYLAVPILGGSAIRLATREGARPSAVVWLPVLFMIALGLTTKAAIRVFDLGQVWELTFLAHADWFAAGMAVAILRIHYEDGLLKLPRFWRPAAWVTALVFLLVAVSLYYRGALSYLEYQTPIAVSCGLVLMLVVLADPSSRMIRFLTHRAVFGLGLASYGLFLWHDPIVRAFRDWGLTLSGQTGFVANLGLVAAVSVVLSAATYLYVERPALARKRSWQRPESRTGASKPVAAEVGHGVEAEVVAAPAASLVQ